MHVEPVNQEVAYDKVNRFKEDIESLIDVTGDVHISTHCHPAKHKAPWQCEWVRGTISLKVRRVEQEELPRWAGRHG